MNILNDEQGQAATEYVLLFGAVIVFVLIAAVFYKNYVTGLTNDAQSDVSDLNDSITDLGNKF